MAKSAPDGYTLLFGGMGWSTTYPAVEGRSKGPDDLMAVCRINYSPTIIAARADLPFKTFKEMLAYAKANPDKLIFGNTGPWGQADLPWKMIGKQTGIKTKNVPYDGGGPALLAVLGGHADVTGGLVTALLPHIKSGKLRALASSTTSGKKNCPTFPPPRKKGWTSSISCGGPFWRPRAPPAP